MRNTLLIIDDSELDRAIFNEIFKKDYRVLRAATASEGVDLVRKNALSLAAVVLDICLQRGANGFAVMGASTSRRVAPSCRSFFSPPRQNPSGFTEAWRWAQ